MNYQVVGTYTQEKIPDHVIDSFEAPSDEEAKREFSQVKNFREKTGRWNNLRLERVIFVEVVRQEIPINVE